MSDSFDMAESSRPAEVVSGSPSSPVADSPRGDSSSPTSLSARLQRRYDLQMDLMLLRQMRGQENAFKRGDPGYEEVAVALSCICPSSFRGVTKKSVRDRVLKLLELFRKSDWKERSG